MFISRVFNGAMEGNYIALSIVPFWVPGGAPAEWPGGRGGGGGDRLGSGNPQKTIQNPDRLYKAPKKL